MSMKVVNLCLSVRGESFYAVLAMLPGDNRPAAYSGVSATPLPPSVANELADLFREDGWEVKVCDVPRY